VKGYAASQLPNSKVLLARGGGQGVELRVEDGHVDITLISIEKSFCGWARRTSSRVGTTMPCPGRGTSSPRRA